MKDNGLMTFSILKEKRLFQVELKSFIFIDGSSYEGEYFKGKKTG